MRIDCDNADREETYRTAVLQPYTKSTYGTWRSQRQRHLLGSYVLFLTIPLHNGNYSVIDMM